mmetsp:Transcript_4538/g.13731  ORF Transcript_4538/g.13731 Transcript_4538/m.13731 type:complete len:383 (-) Transcript_4538:19-1167(-)
MEGGLPSFSSFFLFLPRPSLKLLGFLHSSLGEDGLEEQEGHGVGVDVGARPPVLQVSLTLDLDLAWDPDAGSPIRDSGPEGVNVAGLVEPGQPLLVTEAILGDVLLVSLGELLDGIVDGVDSALVPHRLGREVGVGAGSVPVSLHRLWIKSAHDSHVLAEPVQEPPGDHHAVAELERADGSDLVLPLAWHDLSVDAADLDSGLDAGIQVGLGEGPAVDSLVTGAAVEGSLGSWVAALWPAEHPAVGAKHGVLLLESVEGLLVVDLLVEDLGEPVPGVGGVGVSVGGENLAQHEDVVISPDWVRAGEDGPQEAVRVVSLGLAGGGPIEGPHREVDASGREGLLHDLGLGPHLVEHDVLLALEAVEPDVLRPAGEEEEVGERAS